MFTARLDRARQARPRRRVELVSAPDGIASSRTGAAGRATGGGAGAVRRARALADGGTRSAHHCLQPCRSAAPNAYSTWNTPDTALDCKNLRTAGKLNRTAGGITRGVENRSLNR